MNTCKYCSFWRRGGSFAHEGGVFGMNPTFVGEAMGVEHLGKPVVCMTSESTMGLCLHPKMESAYVSDWLKRVDSQPDDGISVQGYDDRATLFTGQHFGCIHFSAKPSLQTRVLDASSQFRVHRMREPHAVHLGKEDQAQLDDIRRDLEASGLLISDPTCTEERFCGLKVVREEATRDLRIT